MSSLLAIQTKDDILFASDTAASISTNNLSYRVSDNESKLFTIGSYILFVSGNLSAQKLLINTIIDDFNINQLESLLKRHFIHLGEYSLEVLVAEKASDSTVLHTFSSYDRFDHKKSINDSEDTFLFTAGMKTRDIASSFESKIVKTTNLISAIVETYQDNHCEQVGGNVETMKLSSPSKNSYRLSEKNLRRKRTELDLHLIIGERIYGKIIMGVNLAIEDESGILKFRGSRGQIFDRNGNEVMRLGLVTDDDQSDCFGIVSWNSITRVALTDCEGVSISRKKTDDSWEKIFWVSANDGTLYTRDMVAEQLKIVNNVGDVILDAENSYFDVGWFDKIVADGKLTTTEKYEIWTKINTIMSEYQILLSHAADFKYSSKDDSYIFSVQNPESSRVPSSTIRVNPTNLSLKYHSLIAFIGNYISIPPLFDEEIMERTDEIDRSTFAVRFKEYYDEAEKIRAAIDDFLIYSGLQMGRFYNNLILDAQAGFMAIRSDYKYRARLSATEGLALEKWEQGSWVKKLYASLGHPDYEDGTLIAVELVARKLRIVDGNLGDRIVLDEHNGISIYGDKANIFLNANDGIRIQVGGQDKFYVGIDGRLYAQDITTHGLKIVDALLGERIIFDWDDGITIIGNNATIYLNANDGIRINAGGTDKFYVGTDGRLYAVDITTHNLKIVDGNLGEKIIFDHIKGITINGNAGQQIRLNANEGIAIDVNGDKRFWVGTDGNLYARKIFIMNDLTTPIPDEVTGSFISDLTVNKVRTLNSTSPQDHVFIKDNFIKLMTGTATGASEKFTLQLMGSGASSYPHMTWGAGGSQGGAGSNVGHIYKNERSLSFEYVGTNNNTRKLLLQNSDTDSILLETPQGMLIKAGTILKFEVGGTIFEMTPTGIKMNGTKIDMN